MIADPGNDQGAGAALRRARYGLSTLVLLAAVTASCLIAGVLGSRYSARWDVTSTREHTLSPRTLALLETINGRHTIVVSADVARLDRSSAARMSDLLAEFTKASPDLRSTWIDTGSASGQEEFARLLGELAAESREAIESQRRTLAEAATSVDTAVRAIPGVSDRLKALAAALPQEDPRREDIERQAGLVRTFGARAEPVAGAIRQAAERSVAGVALPSPDDAVERAGPVLGDLARAMHAVCEFASGFRATGLPDAADEACAKLLAAASALRDESARINDRLAQLKPLDPLIVSRVLEAGPAVLLNGPGGTLAIDFQSLFPAGPIADASSSQALFTGEQLIGTALSSLNSPLRPIVVLVHAENGVLLEPGGGPSPAARRALRALFDRLRLSRVDAAEWAVADQPLRPSFSGDRAGRPLVWVIFPPPSRAGIDPRRPEQLAERTGRLTKLAGAVRTLVDAGQNLLVCVDPSDLPSIGEADPVTAPLLDFGLRVDSGRPLVRRESSPGGPLISTFQILRADTDGHPIGRAVRGLAAALSWPSPIELVAPAPAGVRSWPLLTLPASEAVWGESQWMAFRDFVARGLARPLEPMILTDPPVPNPGRDATIPPGGSAWVLAAAAERDRSVGSGAAAAPSTRQEGPQRLVVIASPTWLDDVAMQASEVIAGRRALLFPANAELFDAGVFWLAGMDELIAPGPTVRDVPRIRMVDEGALRALRWVLIAGLPTLILLIGVILRVARG